MPSKNYYRYFRFIQKNWNFRLALFSVFHEIRGENKYKIHTTGYDNLVNLEVISKNKSAAYIYQPVNYYMLEKAFGYLKEQEGKGSLVDFGSGQGRILAVAASFGFSKITGVEFAPALCEAAEKNMEQVRNNLPDSCIDIFCGDATMYPIKTDDCIFTFFNPFDQTVMLPVVKNILKSYKESPREIFILYFNPTEIDIFLSAGFHELWHYEKMEYLDFSILFLDAEN